MRAGQERRDRRDHRPALCAVHAFSQSGAHHHRRGARGQLQKRSLAQIPGQRACHRGGQAPRGQRAPGLRHALPGGLLPGGDGRVQAFYPERKAHRGAAAQGPYRGSAPGAAGGEPFHLQQKAPGASGGQAIQRGAEHPVPEPAGIRGLRVLPCLRPCDEMSPLRRVPVGARERPGQGRADVPLLRLSGAKASDLSKMRLQVHQRLQGGHPADRGKTPGDVSDSENPAHGRGHHQDQGQL